MLMDALSIERRGRLQGRYAVCIGAGIGKGILPDWFELTRRVVCRAFAITWDVKRFEQALVESRWSLDSWIQAAENKWISSGNKADSFRELLSGCLYEDAIAEFAKYDLGNALITGLHHPDLLKREQLEGLNEVFATKYSTTTLVQLADALIRAETVKRMPAAIITFNADSLLYLLLSIKRKLMFWQERGRGDNPVSAYNRVFRGIDFPRDSTPILHCHGALLQPAPLIKGLRTAPQNLVFTESSYLRVAAEMSSWSTNMFFFYAQTAAMVFLGLSMSDPNLRRWLGWAHIRHQGEIANFTDKQSTKRRHLWIVSAPNDEEYERALQAGVEHLGVEPAKIPDWGKLGEGVCNLIAV